jgi:hypothetical protein
LGICDSCGLPRIILLGCLKRQVLQHPTVDSPNPLSFGNCTLPRITCRVFVLDTSLLSCRSCLLPISDTSPSSLLQPSAAFLIFSFQSTYDARKLQLTKLTTSGLSSEGNCRFSYSLVPCSYLFYALVYCDPNQIRLNIAWRRSALAHFRVRLC